MKKFLSGLIVGGLIVFGYFFVKENPNNTYVIHATTRINKLFNKNTVGMANPASTYCIENNGTLAITGSVGTCSFSDGSSCEERAFFRGECKPGQKTDTDTPQQETNTQPENTQEQPGTNKEPVACTMEYIPVCAKVQIQCIKAPCEPIEQTFGNKCQMNANKLATYLHDGECEADKKSE